MTQSAAPSRQRPRMPAPPAQPAPPPAHDPEIDGPVPSRARLFVLSTPGQQWLARRRVAALPDAETLVGSAPDSPDASADPGAPPSGDEGPDALVSQLVLAARLEMAAVYADLLGAG